MEEEKNIVVKSRVKEAVKKKAEEKDIDISRVKDEAVTQLEIKVLDLIDTAVDRADGNGRKTVNEYDV